MILLCYLIFLAQDFKVYLLRTTVYYLFFCEKYIKIKNIFSYASDKLLNTIPL